MNDTKFGETNRDCTGTTAFTVLDAYYYTMVSIEMDETKIEKMSVMVGRHGAAPW